MLTHIMAFDVGKLCW